MPPIPITFHFPAAHGSPARARYASGVPLISVDKPRAVPSAATTSSRLIHPRHPRAAPGQLPSPPLSASPARSTSGGPPSPVLQAGAASVASPSAPASASLSLPHSGQGIHGHPARSARSSSSTTSTARTTATTASASARRKAGVKAQQHLPPGRACITLVPQNGAMAARCAAYAATLSGGVGSAGVVVTATAAGTILVSSSAAATAVSTTAPPAWQAHPYHPRTDWSNPRAPLPSIREVHRGARVKNKGGRKSLKEIRDWKEKERMVKEVVREMVVRARGGVYSAKGEDEQGGSMEVVEDGAGEAVEEAIAGAPATQGKRKGKKAKGKSTPPPKNSSASPPAQGVRSSARLPTPASLPPAELTTATAMITAVTATAAAGANPATPTPCARPTRRAKTLSPHGRPLGLPFPAASCEGGDESMADGPEPKASGGEVKETQEVGGRRTRRNSGQPGRLRDYEVVKS